MSEQNSIWSHDDLRVENGFVEGFAYTNIKNGYDVSAHVESYEYETTHNKVKTNHVPVVQITTEDGRIVKNMEPHDSSNPNEAIQNAKSSAEYAYKNLEYFVDGFF
jgi:hypothetical protein